MNSSDENPKLPMWIFFLTDAVLLGAAWYIANHSPPPLSPQAIFAVFGFIFGGALIALVPLIARFERQKNELLDDRQRALEALARTVAASAEQISIAASGFHEIADLTHKNLRHAEQLPHKLQEKIAEFQAQLANLTDVEKEELEKELVALRSSESERLESISAKIAKSATDWSKLEAATHQHLLAAGDAVAKLAATSAGSALAVEAARKTALAELDARLAEASATIVQRAADESAKITAASSIHREKAPEPEPSVTAAAKRPRKPRRSPADIAAASPDDAGSVTTPPVAAASESEAAVVAPEPAPIPAEKIPEIAPVAPHSAEPFPVTVAATAATTDAPPPPAAAAVEAPKPSRKRTARKVEPEAEPSLRLGIEETSPALDPDGSGAGGVERVRTSDGATRLIVTAYIGIGNRLFIRGDGPGLSWEKGVPLQFVSIGKWRWETNDATGAIQYKIFKNDELECAALGPQTLDLGHQQEVTATF
ncbi:MAG: hypothetical protein EXS38_00965 [Opitutus sp.]|nr:hypothetical protein [Opitutus sp.]